MWKNNALASLYLSLDEDFCHFLHPVCYMTDVTADGAGNGDAVKKNRHLDVNIIKFITKALENS